MRFFFLLALIAASALAAPTGDFDAQAEDFGNHEDTNGPVTVAPVETENEPETPVATPEPASEIPDETQTEEPKEPETEPETVPETPEVETPEVETPEAETTDDAPVEATVEPETAPESPAESPAEATEAPETESVTIRGTYAPADETEPVASETEAPAAADDDEDDTSDSTSSESDDDAASPVDAETPTEVETVADATTAPEVEPETAAAAEPEASADEAAPAPAAEEPVVSIPTQTGASAIVDGVTVRFALQATWVVDGGARRRGYVCKITNGSEKEVCGVTFSNNAESTDVWNLTANEDGSFTTKDLRLAPGQTANQFGYVSAARSRPTILAVTFC